MKEETLDLISDRLEEESAAEEANAAEIPIVILPDDFDIQAEFARRPEPKPAPRPAPKLVPKLVPKPPPKLVIRKRVPPALPKARAPAKQQPEPEPAFSMEELEAQIDDELSLDRSGTRQLFSMPLLCRVVALAAVFLLGLLFHIGWGYYRLPLVERPLHYFHGLLRPSGTLGLSLGFLGALVMLSSLTYLVRKSLVSFERLGPIQSWMGFHILTGLLGPAIALFHAGFVPTSALGLLACSTMLIVVASGIVGRYIAVYFPRSLEGREFKFEEVRGRLVVYRKKLAELGVDPGLLRIDALGSKQRSPWLLTSIARVIYGDWESRQEFRRLKEIIGSRADLRVQTELILFLIRRLCRERQWLVRYGEFRRLVGAWRFLHRWLAIVLLVAIFFHVMVGVRFGGLWILGGRK